jgi:hypothetical protein
MKRNLLTISLVALMAFGSFPNIIRANTNQTVEQNDSFELVEFIDGSYRIYGRETDVFEKHVNRGHVDIVLTGDGSTDLDLYVYVGDTRYSSDGNSDDEKVCLGNITRSGYITIKVVNRGSYANDYRLTIK